MGFFPFFSSENVLTNHVGIGDTSTCYEIKGTVIYMDKNMRIMVVCGGVSSEREVSLRSGLAIKKALEEYGFRNVTYFDMTRENMTDIIKAHPDIVFLGLHGKYGEDGCIQGMLELAGIPYTGPGIEASAVCMNKILTKRTLVAWGIPTADFDVLDKLECEDRQWAKKRLLKTVGLPMVLKSPCQGSSIGVVIVKDEDEIDAAIDEVFKYGEWLLCEKYIKGVEVTLPIIGNDELTVFPTIEIASSNEFFDYTSKYTAGMSTHTIPARISAVDRLKIEQIGKRTYRKLGCKGLSRIDFIVDEIDGPIVIEVNTIPGMTEMSLFPESARYAGVSFGELAAEIIKLGLETER